LNYILSIRAKTLITKIFIFFLILIAPEALLGQADDSESKANAYEFGVSYTGDIFSNIAGGNDTGIRYLDNIDVDLQINFGVLNPKLEGTTLYAYGMGNQGGSISGLAGDIQGLSNIESENSWRMYEFWAQKKLYSLNTSVLVGLYDVNSEFNALNSSALFLNSSHGIDPSIAFSGVLGPSIFPYTSLGARIKVNPAKGFIIQGAVLDGVPSDPGNTRGTKVFLRERDGLFMIGEIGYHSSDADLNTQSRRYRLKQRLDPGIESSNNVALGGWYYTQERGVWGNPTAAENEYGVYALGEYQVFADEQNSPQSLRVFARVGLANPDINILGGFAGAGFVLGGLIPNRPQDKTGLAIAYASASSSYIDNNLLISGQRQDQAETNIEITHQFVLNDHVQIQGNMQYIVNPGFNPGLDNALVIGTRFVFSL
jgi:porin